MQKCNNSAGSLLDNEVLLALREFDFLSFKPNSTLTTRFHNSSTGENGVNGSLTFDKNRSFIFNLNNGNNPKVKDAFIDSFEFEFCDEKKAFVKKLSFTFDKPNRRNERKASIAMLKIAYLLAFEKLGHIIMFARHMNIVRNQIRKPDELIITNPFWIHHEYPDNMLGINIIVKPTELKSFLIVFDMFTKSGKYRMGVCLPGFDEEDGAIYENIDKILCGAKNGLVSVETNNYLQYNFDVRESEKALFPSLSWENLFK